MTDPTTPYDSTYYEYYGGVGPYTRENAGWLDLFKNIAAQIVTRLRPRSAIDVGCALGFLVEALRDKGIDARGMDVSDFAIGRVREDVRAYCRRGSILDPVVGEERTDLAICIEVLEHITAEHTDTALANLCRLGDEVLFSSSPSRDHPDPTHQNVQNAPYWIEAFARHGFDRVASADVSFVAPHAMLFRRRGAMRVTFISPTSDLNGGVKVIYEHAKLLSERGHIVTIASLDPRRPSWTDVPPRVRFTHVPQDETGFLDALPPGDALVATLWTTAPPVAAAPADKGRKFYLVQHYESLWAGEPDQIDRTYLELPLAKVCVSSWLAEIMKSHFGEESFLVLNGCDFSGLPPEPRGAAATGEVRIGMLHHDLAWKGIDDGLKAFEIVRKEHPQAELVLFGVKRPAKLPSGCAEFHAQPSRAELRSLLGSLDVFISPSISEGFGLPALEAMACGVPIVVTDSGGCRDYATASTALISAPGNAEALAANLERACGDPQLRDRLRAAGLAAAATFTWDRAVQMMETALRTGVERPMPKLRILYVSAGFRWADAYLDPFLVRAFRSLGHEVTLFEPRPQDWEWERQYVNLDLLGKEYARRYRAGEGSLPSELPDAVRREKPDLVFFNHALMIPGPVLNDLRRLGVPTAVWMIDEPQEMFFSGLRGRLFDYVFVQDRASLSFHWGSTTPHAFFMPHGLDPQVHRGPEPGEETRPNERCDVLILGTGFKRRLEVARALGRLDCDVMVVGRDWKDVGTANVRVRNRLVSFEEAARLYRSARITINVHRERTDFASHANVPDPASPNGSFFYISGCGSLQMIDKHFAGADEFLMPGRHFVRFDSTEDLLEKVDFYLRNEDHRARIAGEGQAAAHGAHTYAHRLRDALEVIGKPRTHQRLFGLNATARDIGAPLQCIILATDGNLSRLQNAIEMLRLSSGMPSDLIVTHFPNPELARWLDQKGVRHRQVARERGAAGLFNQGVREFPGEYFVFVRDEVLPTPNVTQRLIARLEAAPAYGAVGPALNRPRSRQCFQASVSTARELIDLSRALYIREPRHLEEVPTLDPSCFAVRRDALERAGNLDERTTSGDSALDDFCRRLRAAGWRAGWTRSAFVYLPGPGR